MINEIFLTYALSKIETLKDVEMFCNSNKKQCIKHKQMLCEKILNISGYNTESITDVCIIYKELASLANRINYKFLSKTSYVKMTPTLYRYCLEYGTPKLLKFLAQNKFPIDKDLQKRKFSFTSSV